MDFIAIGKMIRRLRKQQNISQEKLARGIMSRENLSLIERGQTVPKDKLDLLFNRLGQDAQRFFCYPLTNEEFEGYELRADFDNAMNARNTKKMIRLVRIMKAQKEFGGGYTINTFCLQWQPCVCTRNPLIITPRKRT